MQLIAGGINGKYLMELQKNSIGQTDWVKAAIAYANGTPEIFKDCWENGIPLTFYGRFDFSVPVSTDILESFLNKKSPNYTCRLLSEGFHPKVIWWGGYGAYIGSANLTDNAWYRNIELGVFFTKEDLIENEMESELQDFFDQVHFKSVLLNEEIYEQACSLKEASLNFEKQQEEDIKKFERNRLVPKMAPLLMISTKETLERRKIAFLTEWRSTLQILRDIADRVTDARYRPKWLQKSIPKGVQADQFLHAFYYEHVKKKNRSTHQDMYNTNSINPERALINAIGGKIVIQHHITKI